MTSGVLAPRASAGARPAEGGCRPQQTTEPTPSQPPGRFPDSPPPSFPRRREPIPGGVHFNNLGKQSITLAVHIRWGIWPVAAWPAGVTHARVLDFRHSHKPEAAVSRYDAVVFDLWGTLVDELTHPEANRLVYRRKTDETADLLGVDRDEFARAWSATSPDRMVGRIPSTEGTLSQICRQLGAEPGADRIRAAAQVRYEYVRDALSPRPGTVETMSTLKQSGFRVGLISNCTEEVSRLWRSTPFAPLVDTAVLSFDAGVAKPDRRIYELAVNGLGSERRALHLRRRRQRRRAERRGERGHDGRAHPGPLRPRGRRT